MTDCLFRYQGQYEDSETGLYYNRFRYYSPDEGIYLSQDPIGLAGGNPTLYGYVKDTNGWVDVLGLQLWKGFSKGKLAEHFQKHVVDQKEFGNITQNEYLNRVKVFGEATGGNIKEENVGNILVKYDSSTG